jgi:choline dehydrogenase-like flavoprotein
MRTYPAIFGNGRSDGMNAPYDFDAIVVGSGISGGWAAKELTEKGLKTLVLERGRPLQHGAGYVGEHLPAWKLPYRGLPQRELYAREYAVQSTSYAFDETTRHFWNNDRDNPYVREPGEGHFDWLRAGVVGGKSLLWGRQVYRWSELDFTANKDDRHGVDWPIRYADIAPWYSYVERYIGVSGEKLGLPQLPDGEFQKPMELNVVEQAFARHIAAHYPGRVMTIGRVAVLTEPLAHSNRGVCHYCGPCQRGCSVGAYFSSLSSTLPAAQATGNLTLRANSVVDRLELDAESGRISGVQVVDAETKERTSFTARVVFLCGSTVGSTQVLLNSRSERFPDGLANDSGALGRYLMDHTSLVQITGQFDGYEGYTHTGQRPNGIYVPRFRNVDRDEQLPFVRGYGFQGGASRGGWRSVAAGTPGFGAEFKHALRRPGPWQFRLIGFGECLPYPTNYVELHPTAVDRYGIPQVRFHFAWGRNELAQRRDMLEQGRAMLESAGASNVSGADMDGVGGAAIHEMGTARMGNDPAESVLNSFNQAHAVPNLFVTDGSSMASSSCVNPSITYMALTARAVDYAVRQLRDGAI